jgi:hypothetical protein
MNANANDGIDNLNEFDKSMHKRTNKKNAAWAPIGERNTHLRREKNDNSVLTLES